MAAEAPTLSIYKAARRIKRREITLYNALRSVADDAAFVAEVAALWPALPLVANLRCGLWYAPPRAFVATCYFKSTDGHAGNWSFSTARLNLHLALLAGTLLLSSSSGQISSHHLILDHVSSLWDVNMIPRCR
jgi:tRNA A64-2'-O-ribosylphosphate transferase